MGKGFIIADGVAIDDCNTPIVVAVYYAVFRKLFRVCMCAHDAYHHWYKVMMQTQSYG